MSIMSKRQLARLFRIGAHLINDYGLNKKEGGNLKEGFCMLGALSYAYVGESNNWATHWGTDNFGCYLGKYNLPGKVIGKLLWVGTRSCPVNSITIADWNDEETRTKNEVVTAMRQFAYALEHGGKMRKQSK